MDSTERKHLYWQCRRGMLENDVLLRRFLEQQYDQLSSAQQAAFDQLLHETDPQLYAWLTGTECPENEAFKELIAMIRGHDDL